MREQYRTLRIKVIAGARAEGVRLARDGRYFVSVRAKRERGEANEALRRLLAVEFSVPVASITIRTGHTSVTKTVVVRAV